LPNSGGAAAPPAHYAYFSSNQQRHDSRGTIKQTSVQTTIEQKHTNCSSSQD